MLKSSGISRTIVANFFDNTACSPNSVRRSFSFFPDICSIFSKTFSREPYSSSNLLAVFSPTPGTPGTIHQMTITDLKANQEYYIYIKSIKVVNSLSYISQSSAPVYFYTNNVVTTGR